MGWSCANTPDAEAKHASRVALAKTRVVRIIVPPSFIAPVPSCLSSFGLEQFFQEIRLVGDANEVRIAFVAVEIDGESFVVVVDNDKQFDRLRIAFGGFERVIKNLGCEDAAVHGGNLHARTEAGLIRRAAVDGVANRAIAAELQADGERGIGNAARSPAGSRRLGSEGQLPSTRFDSADRR